MTMNYVYLYLTLYTYALINLCTQSSQLIKSLKTMFAWLFFIITLNEDEG